MDKEIFRPPKNEPVVSHVDEVEARDVEIAENMSVEWLIGEDKEVDCYYKEIHSRTRRENASS